MFIRRKTLREILDHCYACTELLNEQQDRIESLERQIKEKVTKYDFYNYYFLGSTNILTAGSLPLVSLR